MTPQRFGTGRPHATMGAAIFVTLALVFSTSSASARAGDPVATPATAPAKRSSPAKPEGAPAGTKPVVQPTLDELLGLSPEAKKPGAATRDTTPATTKGDDAAPLDATKPDLERLLSGEEIGEAFKRAVMLMGDAADRLDAQQDAGIDTQRIQEDAVKHLDQLLASLESQSKQSQSKSSKPKNSDPSQSSKPGAKKPGQEQGAQPTSGSGDQASQGPPKQTGELKAGLESARSAWGSLPARVRDTLLQGSSDRFSSKYQSLTERYYRKLAEESGK